jgi:PAS domain S-box-containing protein
VAEALRAQRVRFRLDRRGSTGVLPARLAASERRCRELQATVDALRQSEARLRHLFETASDWYWEDDAEGRIRFVTPNCEAVFGLPPAELIGKRLHRLPELKIDAESGQKAYVAYKARQPFRDLLYTYTRADGRVVQVNVSGVPIIDAEGQFCGYCGVSKDVTAQVEAERALRESEEQSKRVLEAVADYYWEDDDYFLARYVSPSYETLFGVSLAEIIGKPFVQHMRASMAPEMLQMVWAAFQSKRPFRDLIFSREMDGKKRWFKSSGAPIFDRAGAFKGYSGIGAEITHSVETEAAMRLAQSRLDEAVIHVPQPFALFDAGRQLLAFNQAFVDLYSAPDRATPLVRGVSFDELAAWQLRIGLFAAGGAEEDVTLDAMVQHYIEGGERIHHLRDGRWMQATYRILPGDARVALWSDITAIKQAEQERRAIEAQLHHSQRLEALGTLAGGAAHEINNALLPTITLAKLMARKQPEDSRDRRNLELILAGAERSRDLVKQILAFSRKENEARTAQAFDLAIVLGEALRLMRLTVQTSIQIVEAVETVPPISGDPTQLQQVIVNMITNAAQAIGDGNGTITVSLRPGADGAWARLAIADTGCGMDEATAARAFEPFFTTKPVGEGTGLGLSVAHGIITAHGGRIEVVSKPGHGTRFDVMLPVLGAAPSELRPSA